MSELPTGVKDALIAAGGCAHTPEPQRSCNVCGRGPAEWSKGLAMRGSIPHDWRATLLDGTTRDRADVIAFNNLPVDEVARFEAMTGNPQMPMVRVVVDPRKGERLKMFTRRGAQIHPAKGMISNTAMPVFEVVPDPTKPGQFVRLYLHPDGPILSTLEESF